MFLAVALAAIVLFILFLTLALWVEPAHADGIHVALLPDSQAVQPGDTVHVELWVTEPGTLFNGYDAFIRFDPSCLQFMQMSPVSLQEGSYMKGACGNTFHYFVAAPDSLSISHVILCANTFLPGPGQLYKLDFRALDVNQGTWVQIDSVQFYRAGLYVGPAYRTNAFVGIGVASGVPAPPAPARGIRLRAAPNPARGGSSFYIETDQAGPQSLAVFDLAGRAVRRIESGTYSAGPRQVAWDGRDDAGARLAPGIYQVVFRSAGGKAQTRVALLP